MFINKQLAIVTLFIFIGAGFSFLDNSFNIGKSNSLFAASERTPKHKSKAKDSKKSKANKDSKKEEEENKELVEDSDLLLDSENARGYMPDIYRCPDCGYEQDQPGFCPDHANLELVKIISKQNDPLAPTELDGNEDILVDVPLSLQFKKDEIEEDKESKEEKSSKKSKTNKKK